MSGNNTASNNIAQANAELSVEVERHRDNSVWAADRIKALEAEVERLENVITRMDHEVAVHISEAVEAQDEVERLKQSVMEHSEQLREQTDRATAAEDEVERLRREICAEHQRNNGSEVVVGRVTEHERSIRRCQYPLCKALKND